MPDCGNILLTSQIETPETTTMEERTPATQHPRRRTSYYLNPVMELVHANEQYPYTYINNLKYSKKLYDALRKAMETKSATPIDLFVHSIAFRAEAINSGYNSLTEQGNYLCAIALIRMQIDNFLMAWAGLLSKDRDKFYLYYNTGRPVNQLTDAQGNKLTQGYLVNTFAEREPSVKEIYQSGNEYIHPSHIFQEESISLTSGIRLLSYSDYECSEETKREARRHMLIANNLLASVLVEWVHLKHGRDNIQNSDNT